MKTTTMSFPSEGVFLGRVCHTAVSGPYAISTCNNPEPEVVLAISSQGRAVGAPRGIDANPHDVEARSALLPCKAKENNGSCATGPMIRLFDDTCSLENVRKAKLDLTVTGLDGFVLKGL